MLIHQRHTIAEAKSSVDRLHTLVEHHYQEMTSRVQALKVPDLQKSDDAIRMLENDTESLATIHAQPPHSSYGEAIESELARCDFADDLQRSRVYRRNQAFRGSIISQLTRSVYSLGWSFFSDLSMAEVSNISVIHLAITEGEILNPNRSLQTWLSRPNARISIDDFYSDGQRTQMYKVARGSVQAKGSAASLQWEELFEENESARTDNNLDPTSTPPMVDPLGSASPSQAQVTSSPGPHEMVEGEVTYRCKGCGEVYLTPQCSLAHYPPPVLGWIANDCNLHLDTYGRNGLRNWCELPQQWSLREDDMLTIYQRTSNGM